MKSLEIVNERIESTAKAEDKLKTELQLCFYKDEAQQIKQDLEVLEILITNCENDFLDVLHECLIMGTPIHTEKLQKLSSYINKILAIKKTMVGGE